MKKTFLFTVVALLLITSFIFSCSKSDSGGTTSTPNGSNLVNISMIDMTFSPATVTVTKGTIVQWQNNDPYPHHIKSNDGDSTSFESADIPGTSTSTNSGGGYYGGSGTSTIPGGTFAYTTDTVGT